MNRRDPTINTTTSTRTATPSRFAALCEQYGSQHRFDSVKAAGMFFAGLCLYLPFITVWGFWFDEVMTLVDVRADLLTMLENRMGHGHVPGYFTLMWGWARLFGDGEVSLRLPALRAGAASAAVLYALLDTHVNRHAALLAVRLLLLNVDHVYAATQAHMYTLVTLVALTSTSWLLHSERHDNRRNVFILATLWTIGIYTHYVFAVIMGSRILDLLCRRKPMWRQSRAALIPAIAISPWLIAYLWHTDSILRPLSWLDGCEWQTPLQ